MTHADQACCWLTTLRRDGSPHTTPVWFVLEDHHDDAVDTVWIASSWSGVKIQNLQRDQRVSVAVDGTCDKPAVAEGDALLHDLAAAEDRERHREVLDRFSAKYDGWDAADPSRYGPRVMIEVLVRHWLLEP